MPCVDHKCHIECLKRGKWTCEKSDGDKLHTAAESDRTHQKRPNRSIAIGAHEEPIGKPKESKAGQYWNSMWESGQESLAVFMLFIHWNPHVMRFQVVNNLPRTQIKSGNSSFRYFLQQYGTVLQCPVRTILRLLKCFVNQFRRILYSYIFLDIFSAF